MTFNIEVRTHQTLAFWLALPFYSAEAFALD